MPTLKNGQWVPDDHPLYLQEQQGGTQPAPTGGTDIQAPPLQPAQTDMTPAQAAGQGLGWVPKDHPLYGTPGFVGSQGNPAQPTAGSGASYVPPNAAPGTPGQTPIDTQNQNAQTYSQTPGAAPTNATTNQGTQDVVRNQYLQTIQKGTNVDVNDPTFRMQADAFSAAQERARRNAIDESASGAFAEGQRGAGANELERRMINEESARNVGQFEADLVGRELTSRRDEVRNALESLRGQITVDQQAALQRELANLDAAIKRESLAQTGSLGQADISLRDKLGTGALNVDLMRALLQNQQFGKSLGFDVGRTEMDYYLRQLGL